MKKHETISETCIQLLKWYQDIGVDNVLSEQPLNWLARGDHPPGAEMMRDIHAAQPNNTPGISTKERTKFQHNFGGEKSFAPPATSSNQAHALSSPPNRANVQAPVPSDNTIVDAEQAAKSATSLKELEDSINQFEGCSLKRTATNTCFFRGAQKSHLMVIGEAPGRDEDRAGLPFVGRAGQLLDKMLAAIDLDEESVHITNTVYWRPPGNRTPTPHEIATCRPFLERQIQLVQPRALLLLGGAAAKSLFQTSDGIMRVRGKWRKVLIGGEEISAIATLHPAYLLRTSAAKRHAWQDLCTLNKTLLNLR